VVPVCLHCGPLSPGWPHSTDMGLALTTTIEAGSFRKSPSPCENETRATSGQAEYLVHPTCTWICTMYFFKSANFRGLEISRNECSTLLIWVLCHWTPGTRPLVLHWAKVWRVTALQQWRDPRSNLHCYFWHALNSQLVGIPFFLGKTSEFSLNHPETADRAM
jgi:hypothetical protein